MTNLNDLAKEAHEIAKAKGFWNNPRDPGVILMLIVTELAEAMEDVRSGLLLNEIRYEDQIGRTFTQQSEKFNKPVGFPSELADVIIRTLEACEAWGIDIERAVKEKMAYNATRERFHGRTM